MRQERYKEAVPAYDAAIERDAKYYEHFLGRGLASDHLGQCRQARRDLVRSNRLLPTAVASYFLGSIVLENGNRAEVKRLFKAASGGDGEIGRKARMAYIKLDIVDAPGRYVTTEILFGKNYAFLKVTNLTRLELRDVVVRIDAAINGKPVHPKLYQISQLTPKAFSTVGTGVFYLEEDAVEVEAHILQASPAS